MRLNETGLLERVKIYEKAMRLRHAGAKLKEISRVVGVPLPTIKDWARGLYKPSVCEQPKRMSVRQRFEAYEKAIKLKQEGLGPAQIARITGIPYGTISNWIYGIHKPPQNRINFSKRWELGYVVGVCLSDGSISLGNGLVTLVCKDRDFAEFFSKAVAEIHGRKRSYPVWRNKEGYFGVACRSQMLAEFLSDIRRIEKLLENEEFAKGFLRGYSDGDGSVNKQIEVSGSEERIGLLIKALSRVGIQASKPWVKNKAGEAIFQGKYTAKQDTWAIRIPMRGGHAARFAKEVGFGIERKRKRLAELMARSPYRAVQTPDRAGRTRASQMDRNREVMLL